jgi:thioredoxin 2
LAEADDDTYAEVVEGSSLPVLLDLWAPWCGPCRTVSPALEQLARERSGQLKLVKIDVDQSPRVSQRFTVQAIPTLVVLHGGEIIARQAGAGPLAALRTWLDGALQRVPAAGSSP